MTPVDTRTYVLSFPAPLAPASTNKARRQHWAQIARSRRTWRETAYVHAKRVKLPTGLTRVRIDAELRFIDRRPRDTANFYDEVAKPCVDAMGPQRVVKDARQPSGFRIEPGYGLIPGDTPAHLDGPYLTIGEPVYDRTCPYGLVTLTITDLSGDVHV